MKNKKRINIHDREFYESLSKALEVARQYKKMFSFSDKGLKIKIWYKDLKGFGCVLFLFVNPRKEKPNKAPKA